MKTSQAGARRQRHEERIEPRAFQVPERAHPEGEGGADAIDLRQEAANMLRLVLAQEKAETLLLNSSRQARVVLGQF